MWTILLLPHVVHPFIRSLTVLTIWKTSRSSTRTTLLFYAMWTIFCADPWSKYYRWQCFSSTVPSTLHGPSSVVRGCSFICIWLTTFFKFSYTIAYIYFLFSFSIYYSSFPPFSDAYFSFPFHYPLHSIFHIPLFCTHTLICIPSFAQVFSVYSTPLFCITFFIHTYLTFTHLSFMMFLSILYCIFHPHILYFFIPLYIHLPPFLRGLFTYTHLHFVSVLYTLWFFSPLPYV